MTSRGLSCNGAGSLYCLTPGSRGGRVGCQEELIEASGPLETKDSFVCFVFLITQKECLFIDFRKPGAERFRVLGSHVLSSFVQSLAE